MENRRRFSRFDTQLKAHYFLKEKKGSRKECTITDVSRKGMGIRFYTHKEINIGSTIFLEISIPTEAEPVNVKGILKRIDQGENNFFGGIEWDRINGCIR